MLRHLLLAVLGTLAFAAASQQTARSSADVDWGFESSGAGWIVDAPDSAVLDVVRAAHSGTGAGRVASTTDHRTFNLQSDLWMRPVVPSSPATGKLWLAGAASDFASVTVYVEAFTGGGALLRSQPSKVSVTDAWAPVTLSLAVPQNAVYARLRVEAKPLRLGATLSIDDAEVHQAAATQASTAIATDTPTATTTATTTATASATATATATQTATATATSTATSAASPTATQTATARPSPTAIATPAVFDSLTNGDFEDQRPLYGWSVQGGNAEVGMSGIGTGSAALLVSTSTSTKWLHQAVTVIPGGWYQASALLRTDSAADEGWLRLAWYASADGSGAQIETSDSSLAAAAGSIALGPLQAPPAARSVRIRLVLRPSSSARTMLQADNVRFGAAAAPASTPTATASAVATAIATAGVPAEATTEAARIDGPPSERGVTRAPTGQPIVSSVPRALTTPTVSGQPGSSLLRITELLPNPVQPGNDSDFEWIELANLGSEPAQLEGYVLADNGGTVILPPLVIEGHSGLLLLGRGAELPPNASVHVLADGISNGLGNAGDRLALTAADGAIIDAVSWGSDRVYALGRPELAAPGPGISILRRFADDGSFVSAEHLAVPTPGFIGDSVVQVDEGTVPVQFASAPLVRDRGWPLLLGLAALSLGAAGVGRVRRVLGDR